MRLAGRIALVTGSSRGIGAAIARRLAADGAKVVLHASRSAELAEQVAAGIREVGGSAAVVLGDLAEGEVAAQVVKDAFQVHGALDILVCNAGAPLSGPVTALEPAAIDAHLALNLRAPMLQVMEFARLTQSDQGRVVLISSASASHPVGGAALYSASKAAAECFIRSVAQELGPRGITCNAVQPGLTLSRALPDPSIAEKVSRWTALRRPGQPEDIADIVAFLASDEARWLTGVTLPATGGAVTSATTVIAKG
ncbi:MAG: SDR family oxidoreductase [Sphingomonadales bacterium]|nr:SDR family oxidoreductase [Sphingomonadales bacterium]